MRGGLDANPVELNRPISNAQPSSRSPAKAGAQSYNEDSRASAFGAARRAWAPAFAGEQ